MAGTIDLKTLRPSELARLLNTSPLGEVINDHQLRRHRTRAGFRVGDGTHVDLYRYASWLFEVLQKAKAEASGLTGYDALKESARARSVTLSRLGRNIGELPAIVDPARRAKAENDFRFFCEVYFPLTFYLAWSPDHLKVITKIEQAVLHGGLFALAMPRGSGKTSIAETGCLWAMLYGHRTFVCLIGAAEAHALEMIESIKMELESNDILLADFPEIVYPIRCLEGIANRCGGQLYQGERTRISWTADEVVLPTTPQNVAAGAIIKVAGLTGRIRGMKYKRADGEPIRPSLVILDDPQTDDSARSVSQCLTRERLLAGAVLGLAGPGKKISGIMPCTVIRPDDMADRILDRDKHPAWNGERTKMVYDFPTNEKLWARYAEVRAESLQMYGDIRDATAFYVQNRKELDEGSVVAWPERFNHDEASAIQNAMNLKLQDEVAFFAEYQNEPLPEKGIEDEGLLTVDQIMQKLNGRKRREVPLGADNLTMFVDVQGKLLYWLVVAWTDDFTGYIIDYGAYPDQKRAFFTLRDSTKTLQRAAPGTGVEGAIYAGLKALTEKVLGAEWRREDGVYVKIARCLVDANWGVSTPIVYQFCRQSVHAAVLTPCHGRFVGASSKPFSEYQRKMGERIGVNWRMPRVRGQHAIQHVLFDTNFWKSFVHARFAVAIGDKGCLSLFGHDAGHHRLLAEQLWSEYRVRTEGRGRVVDEWKLRVGSVDNHWLDCLVGCAVACSMIGVRLEGWTGQPKKKLIRVPRRRLRR